MKLIGIYSIRCLVTGKEYVGQSTNIVSRIQVHFAGSCNCRYLANAIKKYSRENFVSEIIELCDEIDLDFRESHWIASLNTLAPNGYNLATGGQGGGRRSKATKRLLSKRKSGENHPLYGKRGKDCHMYGKSPSQETRDKISNTLKGNIPWNKGKKGLQTSWIKGKTHSKETREKLSKASKKLWENPEFRAKHTGENHHSRRKVKNANKKRQTNP